MPTEPGKTILFLLIVSWSAMGKADVVRENCRAGTWATCGTAVRRELDTPSSPQRTIELAELWSAAFSTQYNVLRKQGRVEASTPDSEKIFEAVGSKLNPLELAQDKATDALVKRYLPRVAPLLEWANKPIVVVLKAFFTSSEIASDYDELRLMNADIQQRISIRLEPFMKPGWKDKLNSATKAALPQLTLP